MNVDEMAAAYDEVMRLPLEVTFMQIALHDLRQLSERYTPKDHVRRFLERTAEVTGAAVVVLNGDQVNFLTTDEGIMLAFA